MDTLDGILYFEVNVPDEYSNEEAREYLHRVANIVEETDFEDEVMILDESVTPKFLPVEGIEETKKIPVVPHTVEGDELKEIMTD